MHLLCYYYLCGTKKKLNNIPMQIVKHPDTFLRQTTQEVRKYKFISKGGE